MPVGCRREAARRAPKVLRRSGRTHVAGFGQAHRARQLTPHVIRFPCQVVLSREKVAPSARGALRAPLIDSEETPHHAGSAHGSAHGVLRRLMCDSRPPTDPRHLSVVRGLKMRWSLVGALHHTDERDGDTPCCELVRSAMAAAI